MTLPRAGYIVDSDTDHLVKTGHKLALLLHAHKENHLPQYHNISKLSYDPGEGRLQQRPNSGHKMVLLFYTFNEMKFSGLWNHSDSITLGTVYQPQNSHSSNAPGFTGGKEKECSLCIVF